jgi:hypothetical protein
VTRSDKDAERESKLAWLRAGGLLINVDVLMEGYDFDRLHAILDLAPTLLAFIRLVSASLFICPRSRGTRPDSEEVPLADRLEPETDPSQGNPLVGGKARLK